MNLSSSPKQCVSAKCVVETSCCFLLIKCFSRCSVSCLQSQELCKKGPPLRKKIKYVYPV